MALTVGELKKFVEGMSDDKEVRIVSIDFEENGVRYNASSEVEEIFVTLENDAVYLDPVEIKGERKYGKYVPKITTILECKCTFCGEYQRCLEIVQNGITQYMCEVCSDKQGE